MKYFIISGEPSGDLHGSKLIKGIFKSDPKAEIAFWGGDLMEKAGGKLLTHYNELAFMGFIEVLLNILKIWGADWRLLYEWSRRRRVAAISGARVRENGYWIPGASVQALG